jgi:NAD(P)-dependent dehydrogenase (short-subunit alcohol dehydrogenase family)
MTQQSATRRIAIVSGIGPGLGRSIALGLARDGATVVLAARNSERLEEVAAEVRALGVEALTAVTDLSVADDRTRLIKRTVDTYGRIDVLVNNAFSMGPMTPMLETGVEPWREAFEVNVFGTMDLTLGVVPAMQRQGGGSIVMISSQAIRRTASRRGAYAASKSALLAATNVLANEVGPTGIRINSVVPGQIWADQLRTFYEGIAARRGVDVQTVVDGVARDMALRRIPLADEIADAVVFLASDRASAITGQALDVNGGNWFH